MNISTHTRPITKRRNSSNPKPAASTLAYDTYTPSSSTGERYLMASLAGMAAGTVAGMVVAQVATSGGFLEHMAGTVGGAIAGAHAFPAGLLIADLAKRALKR